MPPFNKVPQDEIDNFVEDVIVDETNTNTNSNFEISTTTSTEGHSSSNRICKYNYVNPKVLYVLGCVALVVVAATFAYPALQQGEEEEWTPTLMTSEEIDPSGLDTNRDDASFNPVVSTGTYDQYIDIRVDEKIHLNGADEDTQEIIKISNLLKVSDLENGGREIESTLSAVEVEMKVEDNDVLKYNSETDGDKDDPGFEIFNQLIGLKTVVRFDKYGKVIYSSLDDESLLSLQNQSAGLTASGQYDELSRMAMALPPSKSAKPSDEWDFKMGVGLNGQQFSGTTTLLGYTTYDGADVAVFKMDGALPDVSINMDDGAVQGFVAQIKGGSMTGYVFWDTKYSYPRWVEINTDMLMEMPNPVGGQPMEIPLVEKTVTYAHRQK